MFTKLVLFTKDYISSYLISQFPKQSDRIKKNKLHTGEKRNAYRILVGGKVIEGEHLEILGVDGNDIIKRI